MSTSFIVDTIVFGLQRTLKDGFTGRLQTAALIYALIGKLEAEQTAEGE